MTENIAVYAPARGFVMPYITAALPDCGIYSLSVPDGNLSPENKKAGGRPEIFIMISSTDIYGDGPMENITEETRTCSDSEWSEYEKDFRDYVDGQGGKAVILRCADIVATGMTGFPRTLAEAVWRGTFFHFPGNEARRSMIHATDIGRIVRTLATAGIPAGNVLTYNVTDGSDPTIHDIAEALAYRMANKRISTLSTRPQQWIGRQVYGARRYSLYTTTRTFSSEKLKLDMAFHATDTCEYLRTHVYDENSL